MWGNNKGESVGLLPGRRVIGPLLLMGVCTPFVLLVVHTFTAFDGSLVAMLSAFKDDPQGVFMASVAAPTHRSTMALLAYSAFELVLMHVVPGKSFLGPVTPMGNTPEYTANGLQCYFITLAAFLGLSEFGAGLFETTIIYDEFVPMISSLCLFALLFCLLLYFKGKYAPSSTDSGTTGNPVFDYYWGTELYPRILGTDVKEFTNCRFGMMAWPLIVISFAAAQHRDNAANGGLTNGMWVSAALQLVYCAKFFWWETGYWASIDIMHDRAGYYICWGCLVWLPAVYTSHTHWMVAHPEATTWSTPAAVALFVAGWLSIIVNYDTDRQRQYFRRTGGKETIWGSIPKKVVATYTTADGEKRTSMLLASGYWALSRHFNYVGEIASAFFWAAPSLGAGLANAHIMPFFYTIFLTVLLTDRAFRDDSRCKAKYGKAWDQYCEIVPYRIVPYVL